MPVETIYENYALVFLRLLSLLTGERIFVEEFTLFYHDPFEPSRGEHFQHFELLFGNPGVSEAKKNVHAAHMIANYEEIAVDFGSILKRWFACYDRLKPVLDLYFAVISNLVLTDTSRFLYLAQAIEVYHGRSDFSAAVQTTEDFRKRRDAILEKVPDGEKDWLKE